MRSIRWSVILKHAASAWLLQQQPVAKDLRAISAALKMISDLERIGDQAADIAELSPYVTDIASQSKTQIKEMAKAAVSMVTESVEAFVKSDLKLAGQVSRRTMRWTSTLFRSKKNCWS